jgi:Ca-activated chloride channel family protein
MNHDALSILRRAAVALLAICTGGCTSSTTTYSSAPAAYGSAVFRSGTRAKSKPEAGAVGFNAPPPAAASMNAIDALLAGSRGRDGNSESYSPVKENEFIRTTVQPVSTFGADVDTASYANVRRMIQSGTEVPAGAVRLEEMVNYFPYDYPQPAPGQPLAVQMETAECPWQSGHRLLKIALRTRDVAPAARPAANLVFLVDVSGSMDEPNKLPLVKKGLQILTDGLRPQDRIAMVVYAGNSGLVLPATAGSHKSTIRQAIRRLDAGGSTNGGEGIELAYRIAAENRIAGGVNRVILATDGDFNVGITDEKALERLIETKAKSGVFLSVLGFGMGNLKDSTLEMLADKGNGNYAYIDSSDEAKKVLEADASGTLLTVAKDVKLQLQWNPAAAKKYRLLGYENRVMANEDFANDRRDSGDMGAGHRVTVLYQYEPAASDGDLVTLRIRHKLPEASQSTLATFSCPASLMTSFAQTSNDFRFAAAVTSFGLLLRGSPHTGTATRESILEWAGGARDRDPDGLRREFVSLVNKARLPHLPVRTAKR